ncbi:hypothetical protein Pelo_16632 [Pelomyxa schiedti]|nr:hypothetical protein Pelo_16632 [Pelomyxa schiedti]
MPRFTWLPSFVQVCPIKHFLGIMHLELMDPLVGHPAPGYSTLSHIPIVDFISCFDVVADTPRTRCWLLFRERGSSVEPCHWLCFLVHFQSAHTIGRAMDLRLACRSSPREAKGL